MAKSENLVKNHVQLQSVSYLFIHLFLQPVSVFPVQGGWDAWDQMCVFFSVFVDFSLSHFALLCVYMSTCTG